MWDFLYKICMDICGQQMKISQLRVLNLLWTGSLQKASTIGRFSRRYHANTYLAWLSVQQ